MAVTNTKNEASGTGRIADRAKAHAKAGLLCGIGAYVLWGVFPIYFHILTGVSPLVIVCHRIVWSCMFLVAVVTIRKEWAEIRPLVRNPRVLLLLSAGAVLIALNWLIFIYSVAVGQVLQASMGYFINPVLSVALGMVFMKERLRPWQWVAVCVACAGVVNLALRGLGLPWIALSLALTFGFYGLVRKRANVNALHGLLVESAILLPAATVLLFVMPNSLGGSKLPLLSLSGVLTATPLLLFGTAVRRLKLSTVGFLQYIGPSLQFSLAIFAFGEPLDRTRLLSFVLCWIAIVIYVLDSIFRQAPQPVADEPD